MAVFSEDGEGAVILTNSDSGTILIREILATLAAAYGWTDFSPEERPSPALPSAELKRYEGAYPSPRFGTIYVRALEDRLLVSSQNRPAVEFFPESRSIFFAETPGYKARFGRGFLGGINAVSFGRLTIERGGDLPANMSAKSGGGK